MFGLNLIQRITERGFFARRDSYPTQGVVVSVDTLKNVCTIDTGHTLTDGSKEYLRDVPFQPHSQPKIGWTATVAYASNSPQSAYVAMTQLGSSTPQTSLQAVGFVGGDLSGKLPDPKVAGIQGTPVSTTHPTDGQVLLFVGADGQWEPGTVTGVAASDLNQLTWKHSVRVATIGALPDYTYDNGLLGQGATLTATANGVFPYWDGVVVGTNDRILVKDEPATGTHSTAFNGIYLITNPGSGSSKWVLTRAEDYDEPSETRSGTTIAVEYFTYAHVAFIQTESAYPVIIGSTYLTFERLNYDVFGPSGMLHAIGLVPDPGSMAGSGRFLCEDATWKAVDDTSLAEMPPFTLKGNNTSLTAAPADLTAPIVSGEMTASDFKPSGLFGATAASRYVGGTASGAPVSGTFLVGDFVIDQSGAVWICKVGGSPGTWVQNSGTAWAPLSNGDPANPGLIFDARGEVIMVPFTP